MASSDFTMTAEVVVKSSWQSKKEVASRAFQTEAVASAQDEAQTVESSLQTTDQSEVVHHSTMTAFPDWAPGSRSAGSGWVYPGPHHNDDDILAFLQAQVPSTINDLVLNAKSSAFDNYEPNWQRRSEGVELVSKWEPTFTSEHEWHATSLSWNCTGTLLAVSYGRIDTVAWCHEKGHVCVWQVGQQDEAKPHANFDTDTYITSVSFHPADPSQLAAGAYNGDVLLWDVSEPTKAPLSSQGYSLGSREPVTRLQWLQNFREQQPSLRFVLCSASEDGKVLFWRPSNKFEEAISGYAVHNKKGAIVGVNAMSFVTSGVAGVVSRTNRASVPGVENVMLLGLESGDVYRTKPSVRSTGKLQDGLPKLEVDNFEPHVGPVQSVDCSPFFRNLFLTTSSDGSIRLYSTLEKEHLVAMEPSLESTHYLYGASFSPSRPAVFAAVSRSGHLYLYDLQVSRTKPAIAVEAGSNGGPVLCVAFNVAQPSYLVTGDARGVVRLWRLSTQLQEQTDTERAAVRQAEAKGTANASDDTSSAVRQLFGFTL